MTKKQIAEHKRMVKKAKEIYKKHGLTFQVDPNGYPHTLWANDPSRDDDFEEVFSEEEFDETSWAFAVLADEAEGR
tara:strand:- start:141 stop:368 length:228 start_codon:yes stop_codon:yes gene_type:complete